MGVSRRLVLKALGLGGLMTLAGGIAWKFRHRLTPFSERDEKILSRYIDLFIPADESPGALDLKLDASIINKARGNSEYAWLMRQGCAWLEQEAQSVFRVAFLGLPEDRQIILIERLSLQKRGSAGLRFFQTLREDLFGEFYARPESWISLGFNGPPQPLGFTDQALPVRRDGRL
ncbi:gluconate 2-dehydrogenase subunit 3 family protein [Thiobacillus denitrificans]|uniref:gluconate 2-dehydrogenase subunit 3 family protein n=1 Tax=Thiobacillus denitrificans TaxID=36861 RepID=UPI0012F995A9|nr:gluconate 2-dehydrogenase subunit 3 family protein [Thiobacillus denitrificans]